MKTIRMILPAFAFVFAIVTAFASSALLANDARGLVIGSSTDCRIGDLQSPGTGFVCNQTPSQTRCTVRITVNEADQFVPAFTLTSCASGQELYKNSQ